MVEHLTPDQKVARSIRVGVIAFAIEVMPLMSLDIARSCPKKHLNSRHEILIGHSGVARCYEPWSIDQAGVGLFSSGCLHVLLPQVYFDACAASVIFGHAHGTGMP